MRPPRRAASLVLVLLGLVLVVAGTAGVAGALPPTNGLATDAAQYLPGTTVTVVGSGWTCSADGFSVSVALKQGSTTLESVFPTVTAGSFTQTFTAPAPLGPYVVEAFDQACGTSQVTFEVVDALPTTTIATTTIATTSTTAATTTTAASTSTTAAASTTVKATTPIGRLPDTGAPGSSIALLGAGALVAGIALVVVTTRRRASS